MKLDIISYPEILKNNKTHELLELPLLSKGIIGVSHIPHFEETTRKYIELARRFNALPQAVKQQYTPNRDAGATTGYELGAEWFQDETGAWKIDDKKASYYAFIPDNLDNKWPEEVDLKTAYLQLTNLIFDVGIILLKSIFPHLPQPLSGVGRMLHYHKNNETQNINQDWCGAHFDHGIFTGLIPAYYFKEDQEIAEPNEAGLYIKPTDGTTFEKINACDKSILLFQVGEFGQLLSDDRIKATQHKVKKPNDNIERYTFALFYSLPANVNIQSRSVLAKDKRYSDHQDEKGYITYGKWDEASLAIYRAIK